MFGKTIFSRVFFTNLVTVLVGIIILGSLQMVLMSSYVSKESEHTLMKNADSIVSLINNGISMENLNSVMNGFSKSSNTHIIVTDANGEILVNTSDSGYLSSNKSSISSEYLKDVLSGKMTSVVGSFGGLFNETMFTLEVPITNSEIGDAVLGSVLISTPAPERQKMLMELFKILIFSVVVVIIVSFVMSYMLSKMLSNPINRIGKTANDFASGKLESRVELSDSDENVKEITDLAETFNNMAFELEKSEDIRNSFISDVSHELRTPMTTIGGFVDGILDDTIPPEKQKYYLQIVRDEVTRLSRLVNTFLDLTRIKADKLELNISSFDINEVVRLLIIGVSPRLEEKKINVNLEFETDKCYVKADEDKIKMVLTNLIDNAIKFTYPDGDITIRTAPKGGEILVSVKNDGVGIPEDEQKMIFERLYKVDKSRGVNKEGTGIGLHIVKGMLAAHHKEIKVRSVEGEYAEFYFTLDKGKPERGKKPTQ